MQLSTDNQQSTIVSLHDAISDSPTYRSTAIHFDDQVDLLEKWLELLSKYMKQYVDKLNKFNLETNVLCKKVIPVGIDDSMIDSGFTGGVIKSFSDALQTSLAFKTKLVSDLDDNFIQPLQLFIKTHLKDFKDFRKQHEKVLEKYEAQLAKYTSQSKSKEVSAVREEAFRLYEARKSYVHMSGQHVVRILHFRSLVEHFLVERFSLATASHLKEFESDAKSWSKLQTNLISWKQWLLDDKETCNYQLNQLQKNRTSLENKYLDDIRPPRDLEKYNINQQVSKYSLETNLGSENQQNYKWGYLFVRGARNNWFRRWFFLYDGCFGSCQINTSLKHKGSITLNDSVSVLLCEIKPLTDVDRRNCFEVMSAHQPPFALQAENETEMREWIAAFDRSKRLMFQSEGFKTSSVNLTSESSSNVNEKTLNSLALKSKPTTMVDESYVVSNSDPSTIKVNENDNKATDIREKPSVVMLSSTHENDQQSSLTQTSSLIPLLVWEASRVQLKADLPLPVPSSPATQSFSSSSPSLDTNSNQNKADDTTQNNTPLNATQPSNTSNTASSSWGIPWALVPSMFQGGSADDLTNELSQSPASATLPAGTDAEGNQIVWPIRVDDSAVPKVDLIGYSAALDSRNKELRHLFGGVDKNEVVLFDFIGLLKKKPLNNDNGTQETEVPESPTFVPNEPFEQELKSQLSDIKDPSSIYGYAYTGRAYVTQETFWFYSCVLMHCVNTIAIRLCDIKTVRLIRDASIPNTGTHSNLALAIDLTENSTTSNSQEPLIITALMEDMEVVAEKLKFAVSNAKREPEALQTTYDVINSLSAAVNKNKSSTQVKTIIKSGIDPVRSSSDITSNTSSAASISSTKPLLETDALPAPSRSTDSKKKASSSSKSARKHSAPVQPKSGALAAAMMAASVAGGTGFLDARKGIQQKQEESRHLLRSKKSKMFAQNEDEDIPIPIPNSTISSSSPALLSSSDTSEKKNDPHALPDGFKVPSGPVSCGCENHLDKLEAEIEVPVSAKHLYYMLFDETNPNYTDIWERKTVENKSKALSMGTWQTVDGKKERTLKYIIPVNNPMVKLKEAEVVEKQIIEKADEYIRYVVLTSTKTAQLPYADAFVPHVKYCITWVSKDSCKLCCYTGVKFLKNILVKGMVNKAAMKGMAENIAVFMPILKEETSKKTNVKATSSLKRAGTIKRPSALKENDSGKKEEPADSSWYVLAQEYVKTAQELLEPLPATVKIGCVAVLSLYIIISWIFSGSPKNQITTHNTVAMQGSALPIVSRAVYLRDIDEGLLHVEHQPSYKHSESFHSFMETRSPNRTLSTNHRWFSSHHHQFAIELLFSREKLAMLRHDTLVLFQLVNEIDSQLFENEYTNWLMDTRLQCRLPDVDYQSLHCDDVKRQLKGFPLGTH